MNSQTRVNGTKLGVPVLGDWQPVHIGGTPPSTSEVEPAAVFPDAVAEAEAAAIRARSYAEAEAARIKAEAEADAVRIAAEQKAERERIANERAAMRLEKERADHELRLTETRRKQEEIDRQRAEANAAQQAQQDTEAEQAKEITAADAKWRAYAIRFAFVCGIVSLPVQMSFFWNPRAPWMAGAPIMLEAAAWVVHRGARAAVANHRPVWHYRLIVWFLAFIAAGVNLYHGLHSFDPGTALATAFASVAGPGVWDLHEHGRIRKRDAALTRRKRKAKERDAARAEAMRKLEEKAQLFEKESAEKAARDAAEKLAKDREELYPKVWEHAKKLAAGLGETTVTEAVWRRAHKDVEGTDPGDSPEAQQLRNAAARRMLDARADAPEKAVWKIQDAQVNSQVPPTRRRGSVTGPPVRGVRRPGDTKPFVDAARKQAAITAKNTAQKDA